MPPMKTNVLGRVKNLRLAASKPLLPLYEAIINSIQAIEDAKETNGKIEISFERDTTLFSTEDRTLGDITSFEIADNGIGFTDTNYESFLTSDTTYKASKGGRGVGRFMWLIAFERAEVESTYSVEQRFMTRRFRFAATEEGVENPQVSEDDGSTRRTTVRLVGMREVYRRQCPKKLETIAAYIAEHCLEYLIRGDCPAITVADRSSGESLDLNNFFDQEMSRKSERAELTFHGQKIFILHVHLRSTHIQDHLVHYCADDRVVVSEKLAGKVPNLRQRLLDQDQVEFVYAAYVEADFLNKSVNAERTGFGLADSDADLFKGDFTWRDVQAAVTEECRRFLEPYTGPIKQQKEDRIRRFVNNEAPEYRTILAHIPDIIERVDPEVSDDQLDVELYKGYHALQVTLREQGRELLNQEVADDENQRQAFDEHLRSYFATVSDANASDLARYVCRRKTVIDILAKLLQRREDGKYPLEEEVHRVIFPMRLDSDQVPMDRHNLWLVDERLSYHDYLASDKPLSTVPHLVNADQQEPDILVLDNAHAFTASTEPPFPAITLIEFKRPMRVGYSVDENPLIQLRKYIEAIRAGKARDPDGRDIPIPDNMPFYCYLICDITDRIREHARDFSLIESPDGMGYFGYNQHYRAYFEITSYTKLVSDARKRNAAFFNKLGLPARVAPASACDDQPQQGCPKAVMTTESETTNHD